MKINYAYKNIKTFKSLNKKAQYPNIESFISPGICIKN